MLLPWADAQLLTAIIAAVKRIAGVALDTLLVRFKNASKKSVIISPSCGQLLHAFSLC